MFIPKVGQFNRQLFSGLEIIQGIFNRNLSSVHYSTEEYDHNRLSVAWQTLPPELVREICKNLGYRSLIRSSMTCKSWRAAITSFKGLIVRRQKYTELLMYQSIISKAEFPTFQSFTTSRWKKFAQVMNH
jgi:hypothetical protein